MNQAEFRVSVVVTAEPELAWRAVTDWNRQDEWMIATKVRTVGGGSGVGARLRAVTGVAGLGVVDTMEIIRWEPPRLCQVRHTGRILRGLGAFAVEPAPGGARVCWSESLELPGGRWAALGWPAARPMATFALRMSLHRFSRWLHDYA
jgi:hypothetical protein